LPASTTTPPIAVPCPPIHLVAEWMTMSAPYSMGRHSVAARRCCHHQRDPRRVGDLRQPQEVRDVEPRVPDGLDEQKAGTRIDGGPHLVQSWMSTNRVVIPHLGSEWANRL
jgi:hypothetical protein